MKETYFLIDRDYRHIMRLISAAWSNQKPRQLDIAKDILRDKFACNAVLTIFPQCPKPFKHHSKVSESVKMLMIS